MARIMTWLLSCEVYPGVPDLNMSQKRFSWLWLWLRWSIRFLTQTSPLQERIASTAARKREDWHLVRDLAMPSLSHCDSLQGGFQNHLVHDLPYLRAG